MELEAHATELARKAGALLLEHWQRKLSVTYKSKGHQDPVSEADLKSQTLLIDGITDRYPEHGILSEESTDTIWANRDFLWVLDPLDGTVNYLNRYPCFGVSVAVLFQGSPVVGALFILSPEATEGYVLHARLHGGAFLSDAAIHVSNNQEPLQTGLLSMAGFFRSQYRIERPLADKVGNVRVTGSIVYELAQVASGVFQYAAFSGPRVWDVAAGALIIREAGGEVLVRRDRPLRWESLRTFLEPDAGLPKDGDLRGWSASLLAGNAHVVDYVARNLRTRSHPLRWLRRTGRLLTAKSRARARHAQDQGQGKPDGPASHPGDADRPGPPEGPSAH